MNGTKKGTEHSLPRARLRQGRRIRDGCTAGPVLIANGVINESAYSADSGYNPRTVIGQLADGMVIFICADGRQADSVGATYRDMIQAENGKASIIASDRSRFISAVNELEERCRLLAGFAGFTLTTANRYEGWEYNSSSKIKALFNETIREHYGRETEEIVCPGGLEVAYFVKRIPGLDAIEIGVNHDNPHSADESMEMHSFHKMYRVLLDVLKKLN